jgi:hypothetical protein
MHHCRVLREAHLSLSSQLKRARWRWVLAISHFMLVLALSLMLDAELKVHNAQFEAQRVHGWDLRAEFDYVPRTLVWMVVFDFPAIVAVAPFGMTHATRPLFVLFAGLFWYWCGRGLERRLMRANETRSRPGIVTSVMNGVGLICALALLISSVWSGPGATGLVLFAAVVGWCTAFAVYFGARLARRWLPATWPSWERRGSSPG